MDTMAGYRKTGVRLVARALGCQSLSLVAQDLRGQVRAITWDRAGEVTLASWVADGGLLRTLAGLPVLRPTLDDGGATLVTVQGADAGLVGWRLVSAGAFDDADDPSATSSATIETRTRFMSVPPSFGVHGISLERSRAKTIEPAVGEKRIAAAPKNLHPEPPAPGKVQRLKDLFFRPADRKVSGRSSQSDRAVARQRYILLKYKRLSHCPGLDRCGGLKPRYVSNRESYTMILNLLSRKVPPEGYR